MQSEAPISHLLWQGLSQDVEALDSQTSTSAGHCECEGTRQLSSGSDVGIWQWGLQGLGQSPPPQHRAGCGREDSSLEVVYCPCCSGQVKLLDWRCLQSCPMLYKSLLCCVSAGIGGGKDLLHICYIGKPCKAMHMGAAIVLSLKAEPEVGGTKKSNT